MDELELDVVEFVDEPQAPTDVAWGAWIVQTAALMVAWFVFGVPLLTQWLKSVLP